jgi:hypothetical protein
MIARLKRYEEVLKKNGIDPTLLDEGGGGEPVRYGSRVVPMNPSESTEAVPDSLGSATRRMGPGRLVRKEGRSIYLDKFVSPYWT